MALQDVLQEKYNDLSESYADATKRNEGLLSTKVGGSSGYVTMVCRQLVHSDLVVCDLVQPTRANCKPTMTT